MSRRPPMSVLVAAALDPAFAGSPFTPGQTGERWSGKADPAQPRWPSQPGHVIWCASYDDLQREHPGLPQAHDQDDEPVRCVDLTLEFGQDGTLVRADLEDYSLAATFEKVGMDRESQAAAAAIGRSANEVCPVLHDLVTTLLERTARQSA